MSAFLNLTPTVRVVLKNPFSNATYPVDGSIVAIIDSGYEGFLAVPKEVFAQLHLDYMLTETRTLLLTNGTDLTSTGAYAALELPLVPIKLDGFVETYDGLDEIILGVQALSRLRVTLDYCTKRIKVQPCS